MKSQNLYLHIPVAIIPLILYFCLSSGSTLLIKLVGSINRASSILSLQNLPELRKISHLLSPPVVPSFCPCLTRAPLTVVLGSDYNQSSHAMRFVSGFSGCSDMFLLTKWVFSLLPFWRRCDGSLTVRFATYPLFWIVRLLAIHWSYGPILYSTVSVRSLPPVAFIFLSMLFNLISDVLPFIYSSCFLLDLGLSISSQLPFPTIVVCVVVDCESAFCSFFVFPASRATMDKGKAKMTYAETTCTPPPKSKNTPPSEKLLASAMQAAKGKSTSPNTINKVPLKPTNIGKHQSTENPANPGSTNDHPNPANTGTLQTKEKRKIVFNHQALLAKLAPAREQAKKQKELTLMGILIGKFMDFPKLFSKLRMDWKYIKGEFKFRAINAGWFEVIFANPLDLAKIWGGRPYHVYSQLLLLKPWKENFDPIHESISSLDLWIRVFKLPLELRNHDAISAIIEGNEFGSLVKLDPYQMRRNWDKFCRICVNVDVELASGRKMLIPIDANNIKKLNVWFEDFPAGCGACGELDHLYNLCPERVIAVPTLQITLRKPSSSLTAEGANWKTVGAASADPAGASSSSKGHGNKPYLASDGGVKITYESEDSSEMMMSGINAIPDPRETPPPEVNILDSGAVVFSFTDPAIGKIHDSFANDLEKFIAEDTTLDPNPPSDVMHEDSQVVEIPPFAAPLPALVDVANHVFPAEEPTKVLSFVDEEENFGEDNYEDDFFMEEDIDEQTENDLAYAFAEENPDDFTLPDPLLDDTEYDKFLAGGSGPADPNPLGSDPSTNSINNSMHSSSSMVRKIDGLHVNQEEVTTSNSGKRKTKEGITDSASSELMGAKRTRF